MGYKTRPAAGGRSIKTFTPDDTDDKFYIDGTFETDMEDIHEQAVRKWGENVKYSLSAEYIHVDCIGYDVYDPCDYKCYIVVTKNDSN